MQTVDEFVAGLAAQGIKNLDLLSAMRQTPRHLFVAADLGEQAYEYRPLPIASQ